MKPSASVQSAGPKSPLNVPSSAQDAGDDVGQAPQSGKGLTWTVYGPSAPGVEKSFWTTIRKVPAGRFKAPRPKVPETPPSIGSGLHDPSRTWTSGVNPRASTRTSTRPGAACV